MQEYILAFRLFAIFEGRTTRSEYWRFTIITMLVGLGLTGLDWITGITIPDSGFSITGALYNLSGMSSQIDLLSGAYGLGHPDTNIGVSGGSGLLSSIYGWLTLLPVYSVTARRLHDTGRTGWWSLLNVIPVLGGLLLLMWMLASGDPEDNEYSVDLSGRRII